MNRIVFVLVGVGVVCAAIAWILPSSSLERLFEVIVGTDLLILTMIGFLALLQWMTRLRGWTQDSHLPPQAGA